jgi:hypothetical protein
MITNQPASAAQDIRDIKPPVAIPNGWEWVGWVLGALLVLAILYFAWRWWQKRRSRIPEEPPVPAHLRAKQRLQEALALLAQPKPFCILVSDTIRFYLEEQFDFRAPERTTEEFLHELQATDLLSPEQKESLGKFLESCDLVKFARYEPGAPELLELHGSALKLVEETEPKPEPLALDSRPSTLRPHDLRPSLFSAAAVAAAVAGLAEGAARFTAGVSLFVRATGGRIDPGAPVADGRVFAGIALAGAGAVHRGAGAAAFDQEPDDGQGQRH